MALSDFDIIRRSMTARLFSTVTTTVTVAVAVALMLVLLSMKDAGRRAFDRGSGNMHLLVSRDSSPLVSILNGVFYAGAPARPIRWDDYVLLADRFPLEWTVPVQLGDSFRGYPVVATDRSFFDSFQPDSRTQWALAEGELFSREFQIVVGADAARTTGLRAGDSVSVAHGISRPSALQPPGSAAAAPHVHDEFRFEVVGILEPTGSPHDRALFTHLMSSWIMHAYDRALEGDSRAPIPTREDITDNDRLITGAYLRVATRPGSDVSAAVQVIYGRLRADQGFTVAHPKSEIDKLFTIVGALDRLFIAMAVVVMVASGISIMLALYNSMEQRRRQIAVLRVLGCSRPRIFGLVVTESALLGVLGSIGGVLLALIGLVIASSQLEQRLGLVIDASLPPRSSLILIVATIGLASLAGVIPAVSAYRTSVARNLRPLG